MPSLLSKIILVFLPLFFWPNPLKFELPKVILFLTLSFFLIIWFLLKGGFDKVENKTWFFWVGILLLSTVLNNRFLPGLIGDGYRHQGVIFFLVLGFWMIAFSQLENLKKIWWWISLAVIGESLIVLGRPIGTFGEPNAAAGFLVMGLPILAKVSLPFVILSTGAILATSSKAGLGALLAQGLIFGYLKIKSFPGKKFLTILGLIIILLVGIFGVWQEKNISPFENRWLIWNLGIRAVLEKPVLGYGAEGIISVYEKQYKNIDRSLEELVVDRSHNLFLDIALSSGFLGLLVFLKWLWESIREIKEDWKFVALAGFLIFSFFQPIGVVHWVYLAFLISAYSGTQR
ncbi:MAG: O-antigen ligase family protein [Patescibacteria group bacterium]